MDKFTQEMYDNVVNSYSVGVLDGHVFIITEKATLVLNKEHLTKFISNLQTLLEKI